MTRRGGVGPLVFLTIIGGWGIGTEQGRATLGGLVGSSSAAAAVSGSSKTPGKLDRATCPTAGRVSSGYGPRWGTFHDGLDLAAPIGTPVRAVLAGTVTHSAADDPGGYGSWVEIRHSGGAVTQYGHVSMRLVRAGQHVNGGQVIARVGNEGASTGPHLHLRVYPHGKAARGTDPVPWLRARGVRLPCG